MASIVKKGWQKVFVIVVLGFGLFHVALAQESDDVVLRITGIETAVFPQISLHLQTSNARGEPLADLSGLQVSENGAAVDGFDVTAVRTGIDVTFIIDANPSLSQVDDNSGLTRQDKVAASISRFAADYMDRDDLDSVSVVVPAIGNVDGSFLVEGESDLNSLRQTIRSYEPGELRETPLLAMFELALEGAKERENGRFQAILLFTDGAELHTQLDFPALVAQAQDANVPIYTAILGARADANEIANIEQFTPQTRAFYLHMPEFEATNPIYEIWQAQQTQWRISYESNRRESGQSSVVVNWNGVVTTSVYDIALVSPQITLTAPQRTIQRVGDAADSPLESLQPTGQAIELVVAWPDGSPRTLVEATLFVNGQLTTASFSDNRLLWDIQNVGNGQYRLVAEAVDELGFQATSEPLVLEVVEERPLPPTTNNTNTDNNEGTPSAFSLFGLTVEQLLGILGILALAGLLLFFLRWLGQRLARRQQAGVGEVDEGDVELETAVSTTETDSLIPALECLDPNINFGIIVLTANTVTIGRDAQHAQLIIPDRNISRLHARIKKGDGGYWLYDEGSASGTQLNFERVGLIPKQLSDQATIQFGRIPFRFYLSSPETIQNWVWTEIDKATNDDAGADAQPPEPENTDESPAADE
ncbi:MAG: FHA domain-containing protein [Chloroflexota bacterium]